MSRMRMISVERSEAPATRPRGRGREDSSVGRHLRPTLAIAHAARPRSARAAALALASVALLAPSYAVAASDKEDVAELRRMLQELQAQNRELSRRLGAVESARAAPTAARAKPARAQEQPTPATDISPSWLSRWPANAKERPIAPSWLASAAKRSPVVSPSDAPTLPEPRDTTGMGLAERVKELEVAWAAQEHATQQIIANALSKTGPKINSFLALSGVIEVTASRFRDFGGQTNDTLALSTVELDFDIRLSDWLRGALVLAFDSGTGATFATGNVVANLPGAGVDRFTLDRTHISIGDFTQFPIGARLGREVLQFGTSTGVARLDTLSIGSPLTTEVFENRQTYAALEFAWPTPPLGPPPPPVIVPPVQPLVIAPAVSQWMRWVGYRPLPQRPVRLTPITPLIDPPPFYGSFAVYRGSDEIAPGRPYTEDFNASVGYRTNGHCGVPYEQLRWSLVCPWQIDFHVDYSSSVFESKFLRASYLPFLDQIGKVPGMAASVKASFGPFAVVGEFNSALHGVSFIDALGNTKTMTPMTWQFSVAYQFDWNPWIVEIGQQGSFVSLAYSGSNGMSGTTALIGGVPTRVGFVPQNKLLLTYGEWVMDGLKIALEGAVSWDYPQSSGGTGQVVYGAFGLVQLNF
jgi:uncharacterized coiled-coil protein SlyX